jgi:IS4 transposase
MKSCFKKLQSRSLNRFLKPLRAILKQTTPLESEGDRPLKMTFEDQLKILTYYHLEEHTSGRHLLQALEEDTFAQSNVAPEGGIKKSSFFEALNTRGLEQMIEVFELLRQQAAGILPRSYSDLGDLVAIDGSLIDSVLSMDWADYRKNSKKAKAHVGFNINNGIPYKAFVTDGNGAERPFVNEIVAPGQTSVTDRGYQCHKSFDSLQEEGKLFICRIKDNTTVTVLKQNEIPGDSIAFYDSMVILGCDTAVQTQKEVRLIAYSIEGTDYWIATNRFDLTADQIAEAYKLRWNVETFFAWWKRHLAVYHILARSEYGLKVQIFAGLITYLLLAIYCHEQYGEKVSIKRVRELRYQIINESRTSNSSKAGKRKKKRKRSAIT